MSLVAIEIQLVETPGQIGAIAQLAAPIWREHYTPIIGQAQVDYMLKRFQSADAIAEQIHTGQLSYYQIQHNEELVGYFAFSEQVDALFLSKYYVASAFRGQGIGRQAMQFIEQQGRDRGKFKITLTVNKNNAASLEIYERLGFVCAGAIVQDIGSGFVMDDYQLVKRL